MSDPREAELSILYRVYWIGEGSRFVGAPAIIVATNDDEAIARAGELACGVGVELWNGARRVVTLPREKDDQDDRPLVRSPV